MRRPMRSDEPRFLGHAIVILHHNVVRHAYNVFRSPHEHMGNLNLKVEFERES